MQIGVLALQGDFREHVAALRRLNVDTVEVRLPEDLDGLDGLILPGGESTTISRLLAKAGLLEPLRTCIRQGFPVMGTCAGSIVLAEEAIGFDQPGLEAMHITVERNAFGRQVDSFETDLTVAALGGEPYHAIFIRAPRIVAVRPPAAALATLDDGTVVAAREGNLLALAFHPELTDDPRLHGYFIEIARNAAQPLAAAWSTP